MHWKYHLEAGDAVRVRTSDGYGWGTVRGWVLEECPPEESDVDETRSDSSAHQKSSTSVDVNDYELADYTIRVQSGEWEGNVTLDDVIEYQNKDDRETDAPLLSEDLRLTGGVGQSM